LTNSGDKMPSVSVDDQAYLAEVVVIVRDSLKAAMQLHISLAEITSTAKVWARILQNIIPEERLQECLDFAIAVHESAFPVNAYDLKNAWKQIQEMERAEAAKAEGLERRENPVKFCKNAILHFEGVYNGESIERESGLVMMANGFLEPEIPVPCHLCRPGAYAQFLERRKARKTPSEMLEDLQTTVSANRRFIFLAICAVREPILIFGATIK
jgi:hypothetical protein